MFLSANYAVEGFLGLYVIVGVLGLAIDLIIRVVMAMKFDEVASMKGFDESYFWMCFFLGIIGYIYIVALPDRAHIINKRTQHKRGEANIRSGTGYICAKCQTPVPPGATECSVCGRVFDWDAVNENNKKDT